MNTIALRAFLGISVAELAPKLVLMATGDRVVARVTGALTMGMVGTWFAWASRIGAWVVAMIATLACSAAWLAIVAGFPQWIAAMLAMRATIAVTALWLACHVERPRMAVVVLIGAMMMIVEITIAIIPGPVIAPAALTMIGQLYGPWASSIVPILLLPLLGWAYLGLFDRR